MKKTVIFSFLTILLIVFTIFAGIPFLVRMVTFLGEIQSSTKIVEKQDTNPPLPPKLRPLSETTNVNKISLQGFAEPGATVKIFINQTLEKEIIAEADGSFSTEITNLSPGKNRIKTKALDQAGNESKYSGVIIINYDTSPPELEIESPENGTSFSGEEKEIKITGSTEPEATLKINSRLIILDSDGHFSHSLNLEEGENKILIIAEDPAGNKTEKEITLSYSP
ncbi:hypothetical protein ISS86_00045 [Candidatus Microgenomates bacterium]|nr:hypothetical protein [Candidatus Microgenomates bacterium]